MVGLKGRKFMLKAYAKLKESHMRKGDHQIHRFPVHSEKEGKVSSFDKAPNKINHHKAIPVIKGRF